MTKDFQTKHSRLESFKRQEEPTGEIAGRKVSESEAERKRKTDYVKTSIKIPRELKEQTQTLAALMQISWTALIERGLKLQLAENAELMQKFGKYRGQTNEIERR